MITIEKNIPISIKAKKSKYPWRKMNVGDSFVMKIKDKARLKARNRAGSQSYLVGKKLGMKFSFREEKKSNGFRIWRIK